MTINEKKYFKSKREENFMNLFDYISIFSSVEHCLISVGVQRYIYPVIKPVCVDKRIVM